MFNVVGIFVRWKKFWYNSGLIGEEMLDLFSCGYEFMVWSICELSVLRVLRLDEFNVLILLGGVVELVVLFMFRFMIGRVEFVFWVG